jgi:RNA polymerase subunit RPABC4/transcription elongation factor Spt4
MPVIEFTGNYQDLSTDKGYQFKFFCEKCGNGYMSDFRISKVGMAGSALQVASSLFGGIFGGAVSGAYEVQRAVGGPAHDSALKEAVAEIRPMFRQCGRCGNWICEPVCFNKKAQLCDRCAPDLQEEMAAAQAEAAREQVIEKARSVDWLKGQDIANVSGAACPKCHAATQGGKFCPECGFALAQKTACGKCGASLEGSPKFCPECGAKST